MDQVIDLAQTFQRGLRLRDTQIQGLNEAVAGRDHAIAQFELQVDWADALAHIGMLQEQPDVPAETAAAEEDPEEVEGVFDLDSEHAFVEPNPQPDDSSSGSASSVGNLDDF